MTPDEIAKLSEENERQRARLRKLAEEKANLQLIIRLIEQLNPLSGIQDMVRAMLYSIVDTIGGTNIKLYYFVEGELHYTDFHGESRILAGFDDPLAAQVAASSVFIEERSDAESALLRGEMIPGAWVWGFPLLVGKELLGVIKLENINLSGASLRNYLPIFFSHAALLLSNEIRNLVRLKAEAALHASEVRYRELMQGIHVAIVVHAADTSVLDFNREALDLLGLTEDQLRGRTAFHPDWKFLDADGEPLLPELYPVNRVISSDQALHNMICGISRPDRGNIVWVMVNGDPVRNEQGRIAQVRISFIDITGKKQAEDELEQSRRRLEESEKIYRLLITSMAEGVTLQDANSSILAFNKSAEHILGLTSDQLLGRTSLDPGWRSIHEDGSPFPGETHPVPVALRTGLPQSDVVMGIHKPDGTLTWVSINAQPIFNEGEATPYLVVATLHDITGYKRAEEQLRAASLYTRSLIEASLDPLVTISAGGKITDVNKATEEVTGRSRSELIGTDFSDYFTEPDKARAGYQLVFAKGFVTDYPLALRHSDGHVTDVLYNANVYRNEAGEVLGVFAAARDITERKRAEAVRTRLAAIVEFSNDAVIGKTPDGIIISLNKAAERIYGYSAEELIGKSVTVLAPASRHAEVLELMEEVRNGGIVVNHESERIRKDGAVIQVALTLSPIMDASGNIAGISTIARDITDKKHMEEELRQASIYNRSLIEASLDPLVTISAEGKITDVNKATEEATGRGRSELVGTDFSDYFTEPDKARAGYRQVFAMGFVTGYPLALRHCNGHVTDVLYNASVYRNEAGEVLGIFAAARDITELRRTEAELRALKDALEIRVAERTTQLEAANKELEAFSYSVSHDLRMPLRAIDGFSHILLDDYAGKLDDEGRRLLNVIRDNAGRMGQLIDDMLKFSRTSRLEINFSEIDMEELAHSVVEELQPAGRKLQVEIEPVPPLTGDRAMLRQVFVNLLSNAIKFSRDREDASIQVGGYVEGNEAVYFVRDNGAGFDMQFANKLFGVFQRLHSANEFEGTGIGLAIVKRIVTRHGGRVWAESKVDEGTTIYFAFPLTALAKVSKP